MKYSENELKLFAEIYKYVRKNFHYKYFKNVHRTYKLMIIIQEIYYILKSGISYSLYRGPVNAKTLNKHVLFFAKHNIFKNVYMILYKKYLRTHKKSLTYLSIDSSFVYNKNGKNKIGRTKIAKNLKRKHKKRLTKEQYKDYNGAKILGRNRYCKNKHCFKISAIVDENRIPLSIDVFNGSFNDSLIGAIQINDLKLPFKKITILADKGYDTKNFRESCHNKKIKCIVDYNNRRTIDVKKFKILTKQEKEIYKKRIKVENTFCILKQNKRINNVYDSYKSTYVSFVYFSICKMISIYI